MDTPLVTIVTPSLNQGRFIRATIESVLAQDYPRIEYIIRDGGSTDETAAVAGEYGSRLRFVSELDRGQSDAINKGFRAAEGDIVAWLNSDDVLLDGAVRKAVAALARRGDAAAVYGDGYRIDEHGRTLGPFQYSEPFNLWKLTHLYDFVLQQSLFMRREAVAEAGFLDPELHYAMDWDLLIKIGKRHPIIHIPERMACIREYAAAKSFAGGGKRRREIRRTLRRHAGGGRPPGYWLCRLEGWRGWWAAPLTGRLIDRLRNDSQGLYRDGWAGPRLRYMVPPGQGPILVRGLTPKEMTLAVSCNGAAAVESKTGPGAFEIEVPESALATLEIRASCWFKPASNQGNRRLSWLVRSIDRRR